MAESARKLFLLRHGERIDFTFGVWIPKCFDSFGNYTPIDLNMPPTLPKRHLGAQAYMHDTPLTQVGVRQAFLTGEALKDTKINFSHVYCSPAFRCVQTCDSLLRGMGKKQELGIKIEPGLFEWLAWSPDAVPYWCTEEELLAAGFNIDISYQPFVPKAALPTTYETCENFYKRNALISRKALSTNPEGNILFVGHGVTLDSCTRELLGQNPPFSNDMTKMLQKISYCSLISVYKNGEKWEIGESPCPPITHSSNQTFDWRVLKEP